MPHFNPFVISSLIPCQFSLVSFISSPSMPNLRDLLVPSFFYPNPRYPHGLCGNAGSIAEGGTKSVITIIKDNKHSQAAMKKIKCQAALTSAVSSMVVLFSLHFIIVIFN
jgi:hypothetical protein